MFVVMRENERLNEEPVMAWDDALASAALWTIWTGETTRVTFVQRVASVSAYFGVVTPSVIAPSEAVNVTCRGLSMLLTNDVEGAEHVVQKEAT